MDKPASTPATSGPTSEKRTLGDIVLTAAPVTMTVVATVLAGLASSEMTQAQYHRSLAAQNQSKAGDQWSFFQAKRVRGTSLSSTGDVLRALARIRPGEDESLETAAERLARSYERVERDVDRMLERLQAGKADLVPGAANLLRAGGKLREAARDGASQAQTVRKRITQVIRVREENDALGYLATRRVPVVADLPIEGTSITEALKAIEVNRPESEIADLVRLVTPAAIRETREVAETNARQFEQACAPINRSVGTLAEEVVKDLATRAAVLDQVQQDLQAAVADLPTGIQATLAELRLAAALLDRSAEGVQTANDRFAIAVAAGLQDYTARRYGREASYNQLLANLYEIQVRKTEQVSERHRIRSKNFFYGMLVAQMGVTIASLTLAIRRKSPVLLGLAFTAGLIAIAFASYIYVSL